MKRYMITVIMLLAASGVFAANNSFVPTESSGDWNVAANWSLGAYANTDFAIISSSKTAIVP